MRIRMTTSVCGRTFSYMQGQVVDLPEATAREHIACGQAVAVDEPPAEEQPTEPPAETAVEPPAEETADEEPAEEQPTERPAERRAAGKTKRKGK